MAESASWVRWKAAKKKSPKNGEPTEAQQDDEPQRITIPVNPPREAIEGLLAYDDRRLFGELAGIIETPTMRPDHTILSKPGYDPATGLLLVNPPKMPDIPDEPTKDFAARALRLLIGLLDEFPFVDHPSRSVALSGSVTPLVRSAMELAPMHALRGPKAGSGKSYLMDCVAAILIGRLCPVLSASNEFDNKELESRLNAAVLSGRSLISIDNLMNDLGGAFLYQLISQKNSTRLLTASCRR